MAFLILLALAPQKAHKIPDADLKQPVIWGSVCERPDGTGLAFGGQDQRAEDGHPHTRIREGGAWRAIHEELRSKNPDQGIADRLRAAAMLQKDAASRARSLTLRGMPLAEAGRLQSRVVAEVRAIGRAPEALGLCEKAAAQTATPALPAAMGAAHIALEKAAERFDAEPAPRALSPIAFDPKTKLYVLFGGDHLDYLTNDTWVFDPAACRWVLRTPKGAPPPRADHRLEAAGDGRLLLKGGYTYASATGYCASQYRELDDGDWTYDIDKDEWTGGSALEEPGARVYRTGPFHPDFFLGGPTPDPRPVEEKLASLPENTWVAMNPPFLPRLNRDWGTAVLDPDRDLILRWSGGHSAHGGTDVLHYHLSTNRWELPFPVEFPLGQLYSNTSYPEGVNFNRRPWVTGHTYQNYGVDPLSRKMVFAGRDTHSYFYDPDRADWSGRAPKPAGMVYDSCFYTLTLTPTPTGLVCWTARGALFAFDPSSSDWKERTLTGGKLPGSVVDNSTVAFDPRRNRLLFWRKAYGDTVRYDGEIHAVDVQTFAVSTLSPRGREGAAEVPYLCQIRYDAAADLFLVGGTLPPDASGFRRTPAYDPAANRWVSLRIGGQDPSGKKGRNVSLGLMVDAKRKLFWAVDTDSQVTVLRLVPAGADLRPLP